MTKLRRLPHGAATRLKEIITKAGIMQSDIAAETGMTPGKICDYASGRLIPTPKKAKLIIDAVRKFGAYIDYNDIYEVK